MYVRPELPMAEGATGSEPRRFTVLVGGDVSPSILNDQESIERWRAAIARSTYRRHELIEVQEVVGSGHDEQTEDDFAQSNADLIEQTKVETVAAVVEFIRPSPLGGTPLNGEDFDRLEARSRLADVIEERFGSSVSGGE
jgi:hypothetical protein